MSQELEKLVETLPMIKQLFGMDVYITVIDKEGIVQGYAIPDGEVPQLQVGSKFVDSTGGFTEVMRTGKRKFNHLPKEVMGDAFDGYLVPIMENGSVAGCLISAYSVEEKVRLNEIVDEFNISAKQVDTKISQIVKGFEDIYGKIEEIRGMSAKVVEDVDASEKIVGTIGSNASKSNILALNASIEAARSGEHGRGFAVVAQEMGKLTKDSSNSTAEIQRQLEKVHDSINSVIESIQGTDRVAQNYNEQVKDIQVVVDHMLQMAGELTQNYSYKNK